MHRHALGYAVCIISLAMLGCVVQASYTPPLAERLVTVDPSASRESVERLLNCRITQTDEQICAESVAEMQHDIAATSDSICYPTVVEMPLDGGNGDDDGAVPVRWGQSIPAGMHIAMNFNTHVRTVRRQPAIADGSIVPVGEVMDAGEPPAPEAPRMPMSHELSKTLTALADHQDSDSGATTAHESIAELGATLRDLAHGYPDGAALACNARVNPADSTVGAMDVLRRRLFHHSDPSVRHSAALSMAYAFENNAAAKNCATPSVVNLFLQRVLADKDNADTWVFALSAAVRNRPLAQTLLQPLGTRWDQTMVDSDIIRRFHKSEWSDGLASYGGGSNVISPMHLLVAQPATWEYSQSRYKSRLIRLAADIFLQFGGQADGTLEKLSFRANNLPAARLWCYLLQLLLSDPGNEVSATKTDINKALATLMDLEPVDVGGGEKQRVCWASQSTLQMQQ